MGKHLSTPTAVRVPQEWKAEIKQIADEWGTTRHNVMLCFIDQGLTLERKLRAQRQALVPRKPGEPCGDKVLDCTCHLTQDHGYCECRCGNSWCYEPGLVPITEHMHEHRSHPEIAHCDKHDSGYWQGASCLLCDADTEKRQGELMDHDVDWSSRSEWVADSPLDVLRCAACNDPLHGRVIRHPRLNTYVHPTDKCMSNVMGEDIRQHTVYWLDVDEQSRNIEVQVLPVPVHYATCDICGVRWGIPSFGADFGQQKALEWLAQHREAHTK